MPDKQCLIISDQVDINAHAVEWGLRATGHHSRWLRSGSLTDPSLRTMAWSLGGGRAANGLGEVSAGRWSSVLFRIHRAPEGALASHSADRNFVAEEWAALQRSIWALGPEAIDALWVNAPAASARAENKLVQLQEVRHCDLAVPETLIGNDPEAIFAFVAEHPRCVYKPFIPHTWEVGGRSLQTPASVLPDASRIDPRALALCPGIYQALIEKRADWRVTVIGQRVYPARITAHAKPHEIDWRPTLMLDGRTRCEPGVLPAAVVGGIQQLMKRLNLCYGAIDLVEDLDGNFWFLEVNQVGQFLFVEQLLPQLPLLQSLCAMLAEGRTDYDLDTCRGVSLAAFSDTTEHAAAIACRVPARAA
jgi:hypothetical protein